MQGPKLKHLIKEAGHRQEDFAAKLGISRNQLLVILKSNKIPKKHIPKICQLLKIDRSVLDEAVEDYGKKIKKLEMEVERLDKALNFHNFLLLRLQAKVFPGE